MINVSPVFRYHPVMECIEPFCARYEVVASSSHRVVIEIGAEFLAIGLPMVL